MWLFWVFDRWPPCIENRQPNRSANRPFSVRFDLPFIPPAGDAANRNSADRPDGLGHRRGGRLSSVLLIERTVCAPTIRRLGIDDCKLHRIPDYDFQYRTIGRLDQTIRHSNRISSAVFWPAVRLDFAETSEASGRLMNQK